MADLNQATGYGEFGRYQKRLCFVLFVISVPIGVGAFQFLVTHRQPPFRCNISDDKFSMGPLEGEPTNANFTKPKDFAGNFSGTLLKGSCQSRRSEINITDHRPHVGHCVFFGEHKSVVTEYELVCNKAWIKPLLVAIFMVGLMIGGQVGGALSDKHGRRKILLAAIAWQIVCNLLLSFTWDVPSYGVILFFVAMPGSIFAQAGSLIGSEFVCPSKRSFPFFCMVLGFSVGYMLLPLTAYFIHDWRWWFRIVTLFCSPAFPIVFIFVDETPMWLIAAGKKEETVAVMRKINKYNKVDCNVDLAQLEGLNSYDDTEREGVWANIKTLSTVRSLLTRLLVVFFGWLMLNMTYLTIALNNDSLSGDWLWNIFFFGLVELASAMGYGVCSKFFSGRNCYVVLMVVTTVSLALTPFVTLANGTAGIVLSLVSKFNVTVCYNIIYVYTGELFPTNVRHTVLALSSAVSRLGGILAPFIIYADEISDSVAPSIGVAIAIFLSALSFLYLPDSKEYSLPQTVNDARIMRSDIFRLCHHTKTLNA